MVFKCQPARERGRGGARREEGRGEVGRGVFVLSWLRASQASDLQLKPKVFLPSCNKILTENLTGLKDCLPSVYLQLCML